MSWLSPGIGQRWLFIFDDLDRHQDLEGFLPLGCAGDVLVTTRYSTVANAFRQGSIRVEPFNTSEKSRQHAQKKFETLLGWQPNEEIEPSLREAASKILWHMDGLVLGIQQLAALINHWGQSRKLSTFLKSYEQYPHKWHEQNMEEGARHTLQTLWGLTLQELKKDEFSNAAKILGIICCLNPSSIDIKLFYGKDNSQTPEALRFCDSDIE